MHFHFAFSFLPPSPFPLPFLSLTILEFFASQKLGLRDLTATIQPVALSLSLWTYSYSSLKSSRSAPQSYTTKVRVLFQRKFALLLFSEKYRSCTKFVNFFFVQLRYNQHSETFILFIWTETYESQHIKQQYKIAARED